ncbi:hypothetical protein P175DRAFT_0542011 [Aspergillus ochraceoroseus IBT 24754]|uniref:FAD-binding PCMH-type domain-containing protein n=3 Tax=Aspergillus subgen. Nidulantes TaxID=2720870 RepID=A0A0F8UVR3_9EURO|nr:uncharacterized protein P175DRAFT_0542011 [Aspergillus ochraceoroseus IBT 24754]KKK13296.1 hypothetical protein AOCH_003609 [Aspergillus ochraceoroseus]KKK14866.1 hypothetical protein ARAM_002830 [Aspergillus rambellii]PTU22292.1 hypothetical protein P175DRAFT_0542011 [Aspergillus ochraceoroseus IBT 24754]
MVFMDYAQTMDLRRELEGTRAEVICLGSDTYAESIRRWSDTCEKEAGAVVNVRSTDEVAIVVNFARRNHVEFVAEGGGHSTTGASATHGGIVISMTKMRKVLTDPASKTVCVQGGATWDEVNQATAPHRLAVVGATASRTGVGGSTLGGGYGWLTGRYGLIIDNLISVKMVLADGSVVEASENAHKDLFWAIRGAGQAFGVVTEFVFQAHDLPDEVFGGLLYFTVDKLPNIVDFANWFHEMQDENSGLFFGFTAPSAVDQSVVMAIPFYNGTRQKAEIFFAPLLALHPVLNKTAMMSYVDLNRISNVDPSPEGRKCVSGANIVFPVETMLVHQLWGQFDKIMENHPRMGHSVLAFELIPYGKVISVPIETTACANRGRFYNVGLLLVWYDPEQDSIMRLYERSIISKIEHAQCEERLEDNVDAYPNYAGHEVGAKYLFGSNLPRLQELKKIYDQHNVFHKWHNLLSHTEVRPV